MTGNYKVTQNLEEFLSKIPSNTAVLCGSGISSDSGLPSARAFMKHVLTKCKADMLLDHLDVQLPDGVPLRFEGLLEVIQRTVDSDLDLLDKCYFPLQKEQRVPNALHYHLAKIASSRPVLTTNFDTLIEEAMHRDAPSSNWFNTVRSGPNDWNNSVAPEIGLWKIHGTIRVWNKANSAWMRSENAAPVATLRSISRSRRDAGRRDLLGAIVRRFDVLVVGYSGADDFDISHWLAELPKQQNLYWIAYEDNLHQIETLLAERRKKNPHSEVYVFNAKEDPKSVAAVVQQVSGVSISSTQLSPWDWKVAIDEWAAQRLPSPWEKHIVTGELLKHCSRFQKAIASFQSALQDVDSNAQKKAITQILLSEAQVEIGDNDLRKLALENAKEAMSLLTAASQDGMLGYLQAAKIARATALRLASPPDKEQAIKLLHEVIDNPIADPFEQARGVAELVRLKRHTGKAALYSRKKFKELREGDLYVEALLQHEHARVQWRRAKEPSDVERAINEMEQAVKLRKQLGDVRGLCASTNVLGSMWERLAEWYEWEPPIKPQSKGRARAKAGKSRSYSRLLAKKHELRFDLFATQLDIGVQYLRRKWIHRAEAICVKLEGARCHIQPEQEIKLDFLKTLLEIAGKPDLNAAIALGRRQFEELHKRSSNPRSGTTIEERLQSVLYINWKLCEPTPSPFDICELLKDVNTNGIKGVPYWEKRIRRLKGLTERISSSRELAGILLDPLGP